MGNNLTWRSLGSAGLEGKGRGRVHFGAGPHCAAGQHQRQAPAGGARLSRDAQAQGQLWGSGTLQGQSCSHGHTGHGVCLIPGHNRTESTWKIPVQKPTTR
ncbi:unnamed protein product [Rangifer tarandus platyrhynchus]|uniref:Uncharacterized protein n=1 Tax=Rangifer tarandus platyrhynchus TaxID=3082113 RepID=A0AC59Z6R9_RANTA